MISSRRGKPFAAIGEPGHGVALHDLTELEQIAHREREVAVGSAIDAVGRGEIGVAAAARGALWKLATVIEIGGEHLELKIEDRLHQADLNERARAGAGATGERGEQALREMIAADVVGDGEAHRDGAAVSVTGEPRQARERLDQQVLTGLGGPGARVAVAGDDAVDQARIDRAGGLPVQPELLHHAGAEVVCHDVGAGDERADLLKVGGVLEIGGVGPLVAVDGVKDEAVAVDEHVLDGNAAAGFALAGALDFDDARTQVRKAQSGKRRGKELGEFKNEQAVERFHRRASRTRR